MYIEGEYFKDPNRHNEDSSYKVNAIKKVLFNYLKKQNIVVESYADVGCGSGDIVKLLGRDLKNEFDTIKVIKGFDVSPHVEKLNDDLVEFCFEDFTVSSEKFDLVSLNDVFEHIPDPINFLKEVSKRTKHIVFHIPLENCLSVNIRNLQKTKLNNPGHLIFLDFNSAINLLTFSGLSIVDYEYSKKSLDAPSNSKTIMQKIAKPFKKLFITINPYLYSKIFGISLIVIAKSNN